MFDYIGIRYTNNLFFYMFIFYVLKSSGVKISDVAYKNIQGTSATQEAVTFDCSSSNPCTGIRLQDIKLTYKNKTATSSCKNIAGSSIGILMPQSCL